MLRSFCALAGRSCVTLKVFSTSVLAAVAITASVAAQAGTLSLSYTTTTPIGMQTTDWSGSLSFPQFNSSLGSLNSVTLDLSGSLNTALNVYNISNFIPPGEPSSGSAGTQSFIKVEDPGLTLASPALTLSSPSYAYALAMAGSSSSGLMSNTGTSSNTYTSPAELTEFTGGGSIVLSASTLTTTLTQNLGGNTASAQNTTAALTGTVIYTYTTPVPEPPTPGLLFAAAGAALMVHRGWRSRASAGNSRTIVRSS